MNDSIFAGLMSALDLVVIERLPNGYLTIHGNVPPWFQGVIPDVTTSGPVPLDRTGSFLHTFLEEAARFWWNNSDGCLKSGPCAATDGAGQPFHFEASALSVDQRRFLLVERLADFADTQRVLQIARDQALAEEKAGVRRQVINRHIDKVVSLIQALAASELNAQQSDTIQKLKREGEALQKTLGQD